MISNYLWFQLIQLHFFLIDSITSSSQEHLTIPSSVISLLSMHNYGIWLGGLHVLLLIPSVILLPVLALILVLSITFVHPLFIYLYNLRAYMAHICPI